ncbi:aldo/keto reductase [Paraburkholderia bonniea]|uniref:aldo/keto reductase n=1 Tax=Paraburkholderia bonniea TaxID=2152891 RepID=UPI00129263DF|nr:aldo/keto reductase [Paraburkholderia bonniea]WJF91799.1 aldo/keto reductase [Paraburkholderia bonniea]WJF95118.1 aldo/keto reductase [Paraburkholderia bonniea]
MTDMSGSRTRQRRYVGRSAVQLTGLGLGSAALGGLYRDLAARDAHAAVDAAWDAGIRYFDTAPHYGHTKAERRLGDALQRYPRADYVLSTKVGRRYVPRTTPYDGSEGWDNPLPFEARYDYTYDGIFRSFEDSQQRLGIVEIDLVLIHDIGHMTHGEHHPHYWQQLIKGGGFRALERLRDSGAVKAIGLGVNESAVILAAMDECDLDCALLAGRYTLLEQAALDELLPACSARQISVILGGAFNSGILAHGITPARTYAGALKFNYANAPASVIERVAQLEVICRQHEVPLAAAALQFPYAHPAVVSVLSGARSVAEVCENQNSFEHPLPAGFWSALRDAGLIDARAPLPAVQPFSSCDLTSPHDVHDAHAAMAMPLALQAL